MISVLVERLAVAVRDSALHGDSLLEQLAEARYPSISDKGAGSGNPSPINDAAVDLWERVGDDVRSKAADWCGYFVSSPTTALLAWATSFDAADRRGEVTAGQSASATLWLQSLIDDITALLNPPKLLPIRGHHCPECGAARVQVGRGILATEQPSLVALPSPLSISCRNCGAFAGGGAGQRQNIHEVVRFALRAGAKPDEIALQHELGGIS